MNSLFKIFNLANFWSHFFINTGFFWLLVSANEDAKRLFEDILSRYNQLIRPARMPSEAIEIQFKFKLLQILDVHEKNQVLTTSGVLIHKWNDARLQWDPRAYGNVTMLHVPGELIWLPVNFSAQFFNCYGFYDIILYNNAHGSPAIASVTKADVYYNGDVVWIPPVVYNSMCLIDIRWFPYDEQFCDMKFGSWTYGGYELDMIHPDSDVVEHIVSDNGTEWKVELGIDLSDYQESVEFDLLSVVGVRHEKRYTCCDYPAIDITYYLNIRRKKLFYTINLMVPCVGIAALTSFVFYLPSESHNKITLCINILVALTVFFLLLVDIIPPISIATPLIGKYLIFVMCMVTASVVMTIFVQNIHYKTSPIPKIVHYLFIDLLGKYVLYKRPRCPSAKWRKDNEHPMTTIHILERHFSQILIRMEDEDQQGMDKSADNGSPNKALTTAVVKEQQQINSGNIPVPIFKRVTNVGKNIHYIMETLESIRLDDELRMDWRYISMVFDRIMLIVFSLTIMGGTVYTLYSVPGLQDTRIPITFQLSESGKI